MCYYNSLALDIEEISRDFKIKSAFAFTPRRAIDGFKYEPHPVLVKGEVGFELRMMNWGFLPREVKNAQQARAFRTAYTSLVAKCEKYTTSRFYKEAFSKRHCLIPSTGFFEKRYFKSKGKTKEQIFPYYISPSKAKYFLIAGIFQESHFLDSGQKQQTMAVVTRSANALMQQIHNNPKNPNRMPLILNRELAKSWLGNDEEVIPEVLGFTYPETQMRAWPVTTKFTSSDNPTKEEVYKDLPALEV